MAKSKNDTASKVKAKATEVKKKVESKVKDIKKKVKK